MNTFIKMKTRNIFNYIQYNKYGNWYKIEIRVLSYYGQDHSQNLHLAHTVPKISYKQAYKQQQDADTLQLQPFDQHHIKCCTPKKLN